MSRAHFGFFTIVALILLRLAVGWHFFCEGSEKLAYDSLSGDYFIEFNAEPFLTNATGPLADTMRSFAPGTHDWRGKLAQPQQLEPLTAEQEELRTEWRYDYTRRRSEAGDGDEPVPIEIPDFAPYADWGRQIVDDWQVMLDGFAATESLSEDQQQQARDAFASRHQQLVDYLDSESDAIAEYRHELWRLEQMQDQPTTGGLPYHDQRIAVKSSEVSTQPLGWVAQVDEFEQNLQNDLHGILTAEQKDDTALEQSLSSLFTATGEQRLKQVNFWVTCLTVGVGVCLLLGFFTRLASVAGVAFLLSIMASQPPWVVGARTEFFFYQLVECAAFLVIFAVGAGRWLGLDFFTYALWNRWRGDRDDEN